MLKKLLLTTLLMTSLFSYEIVIDKTSQTPIVWGDTFMRDDAKDVVVNDKTGLMWQDDSSVKSVQKDWQDAKTYCENLNFAGYNDWYLPSIKELETLVDTTKYNPAIKDGFKNATSSYYWSSSPNVSYSKLAWYVYFKYGFSSYYNKTDEDYVRCARSGQ